ncbi:3-hydroxyisobutyrate dehydrogenase [Coriobacterium glomerans PW2]|uniref:3-hydroxyisobutyrate dehydrogenase n=1 Tax=Coriobacterium glomerans (strain ATCC 49209 / DSM 20642 / JCM 10262 / PW2) TaxID=700015 RepID=F2N779_CORGP|nr:NAD(P)-dependent oxidoreductase [Coriobacterium glomerans]AEB06554.1 3-hydroxyisobutyrate dehydrogenase [Coriobacterium glomerans PW2]
MTDSRPTVAFIGTGIMGAPIAGNLLDAGYPLTVHNHTRSKADGLVERGARWAASPSEAARDADFIFTMVGFPEQVEEIYLSGDGLLAVSKPGAVLIDLTTSSPSLARDIAAAAQVEEKLAFDCPVTGGDRGAIAGTLTAIVGATERDIRSVRPLLDAFTSKICCFGAPGAGQAAKLANQVSLASCMVGMADALAYAESCGLDLDQTRDMILGGTGSSGAMAQLAPLALAGDWEPGFMVKHFLKDLGLAIQDAEEHEVSLPGTETAFSLYDMLETIGGGQRGTQAISLLYQDEDAASDAGLDWSLYTANHEHDSCSCASADTSDHDGCACGCRAERADEQGSEL